ncbi:MAG: ion transporter [Treponemataceae bacterium]|nr:ion transporter [Treponemataceae bacterium]
MSSQKSLKHYLDGKADTPFEFFMLFVILVNIICLGFETSQTVMEKYGSVLNAIDTSCLAIFCIELVLKIIAFNKEFFKSKWNVFDAVIVLVSLAPAFSYFTVFKAVKVFRSVRIVRALRSIKSIRTLKLVSGLEHLQVVLKAIVKSIPGIVWTCIMLFIFYYIYAIVGTMLFGELFPRLFGGLGRSFLTLFSVMIFDNLFEGIIRPIMQEFSWAWVYFISFSLITSFVIMNVIVGIVVDSIDAVHKDYQLRCNCEDGDEKSGMSELLKQVSELSAQVSRLEALCKKQAES